jgi:hypothetical protein
LEFIEIVGVSKFPRSYGQNFGLAQKPWFARFGTGFVAKNDFSNIGSSLGSRTTPTKMSARVAGFSRDDLTYLVIPPPGGLTIGLLGDGGGGGHFGVEPADPVRPH